jgi:hypothetical protein
MAKDEQINGVEQRDVERSLTTSLLTDAAIVAAPSLAVYVNHHLNKPKDAPPPPPQEPPKK